MLLFNKIIGFFNYQYLWKETTDVLDFAIGIETKER